MDDGELARAVARGLAHVRSHRAPSLLVVALLWWAPAGKANDPKKRSPTVYDRPYELLDQSATSTSCERVITQE